MVKTKKSKARRAFVKVLSLMLLATMVACDKDDVDPIPAITAPTEYSFERDGSSTVSFTGQTTRIGMATELVNAMKDFNVNADLLLEMYSNQTASGEDADPYSNVDLNASSKSVKSKVAASADLFSSNSTESSIIKQDFEDWMIAQVEEVFPNQNQLAAPGEAGQIADGSSVRYVSGQGLEYDQAVNKGLIGALMTDQLLNNYLSPSVLDAGQNRSENDLATPAEGRIYTTMEHKWDEAYGYLFGASASPENPLVDLGADAFLNKYLARVENDADFTGIAQDIYDAFKLGRAAIVAGDYTLRDQQAGLIKDRISEVIGIRAVYYLQQGKIALANGDFGTAFHDLSEGFGFIYSLRFARQSNNAEALFSREEVDSYLDQLLVGNGFWDVTPETLDVLSTEIAAKFEFSVAEAGE